MSILIPGVSLPPKNTNPITLMIFHDGTVWRYCDTTKAKAIELPPHGRLGDLDALAAKDNADYEDAMASIADVSSRSIVCQIHDGAQKMIAEAETILPADPEGGDAQ